MSKCCLYLNEAIIQTFTIMLHAYTIVLVTDSSLSVGVVGGIAGGVGGVLLLIILVMAVLLLTVRIRKSGNQDISTATTTGEALDTSSYICTCYNGFRNCYSKCCYTFISCCLYMLSFISCCL